MPVNLKCLPSNINHKKDTAVFAPDRHISTQMKLKENYNEKINIYLHRDLRTGLKCFCLKSHSNTGS